MLAEICFIGPSRALDNLITILPPKSPCSSTKPSFGIITSPPKPRKSKRISRTDLGSDFYLGFTCCKPKLKWSSTKFDSSQISVSEQDSPNLVSPISSFLPIVKNTLTSGRIDSGKSRSITTNSYSSTPTSLPFPSVNLTPWEEKTHTKNSWSESSNSQTIFESTPSTGEVLTAPQQPQNLTPRLLPSTTPLPRHLTVVPVRSTSVPVTTGTQIHHPLLPISSFGSPLAPLSPYEEYIFNALRQSWLPDRTPYQQTNAEGDPDAPDQTPQLVEIKISLQYLGSNPF